LGIAELRIVGRATQGVRLIKINEGDSIAAVAKVEVEVEVEEELEAVDENLTITEEMIPEEDAPINTEDQV
jgi:DNA gyrase subunit A